MKNISALGQKNEEQENMKSFPTLCFIDLWNQKQRKIHMYSVVGRPKQ